MVKQSTLFDGNLSCSFCDVVNKEKAGYIIFNDELSTAFLDTNPLFPGHVLLVPNVHYSELTQIPNKTIDALFNNAKLLSNAIEKSSKSDGTFIAINNKVSQSVPHLHIHIVPRKFKDGLKGFFWPRYKYLNDEEINKMQNKIIDELKKAKT